MKKLLFVFLIIATIFSICLFGGCGTKIETKKSNAKEEISNYVASKTENDYFQAEWSRLREVEEAGIKDIEAASTQQEIDRIICDTKLKIDGIVPKATNKISNGVYFIADNSWESYIRNAAKKSSKNEAWIQTGIEKGVDNSLEITLTLREDFWAVIVDNQITLSKGSNVAYSISENGNQYSGEIVNRNIDFFVLKDDIYIKEQNNNILHLKKDSSYNVSDDSIIRTKCEKPIDILYTINDDYVQFQWGNKSEYGNMGAVAEISKSNTLSYTAFKLEFPYMNMYTIELSLSDLNKGDNYLRIHHCGGARFLSDKKIELFENSDYIVFKISVDEIITIEEVK